MTITIKGARRIEIEDMAFIVEPEGYQHQIRAYAWGQQSGLQESDVYLNAIGGYVIIDRIKAWEGIVDEDGKPATCTMENKLQVFAQRPALIGEIAARLNKAEDTERKNFEPSQDGQNSLIPKPVSNA